MHHANRVGLPGLAGWRVGRPSLGRVDVEVTAMTKAGRTVARVAGVTPGRVSAASVVVKIPRT
jgi:hypothetical protein